MLVMGAKLQTWMTLAPLNVGFGADVGANRRGGLPDLLGGLESEFLAGDHRLELLQVRFGGLGQLRALIGDPSDKHRLIGVERHGCRRICECRPSLW